MSEITDQSSGYYEVIGLESSEGSIIDKNDSYVNVQRDPVPQQMEDILKQFKNMSKQVWLLAVVVALIAVVFISFIVAAYVEIYKLKEKDDLLDNTTQLIINALVGLNSSSPASSCAAILLTTPSSISGYYWIRSSNGSAVHVYCDMTKSCGGITGGWMRIANLDMTDSTSQCPTSLCLNSAIPHTCRICTTSPSCSSDTYSTNIVYSRTCGRIKAYQVGTVDAFEKYITQYVSIDEDYVDGVSLTRGNPKHHIWTFAAAANEVIDKYYNAKCPCDLASQILTPPFVGNDYFCDTAAKVNTYTYATFYTANPLWDGDGCGPSNACCSFNNPPWFYKELLHPTNDDIEMRVCRNEKNNNEDIAIEIVKIYVQ